MAAIEKQAPVVMVKLDGVIRDPAGNVICGARSLLAEMGRLNHVVILSAEPDARAWLEANEIAFNEIIALSPVVIVADCAVPCRPLDLNHGEPAMHNAGMRFRELTR